jgi:hypothetical protein
MVCTPCEQAARALEEKYKLQVAPAAPDPPADNNVRNAVVVVGIGAALLGLAALASRHK